MPELKQLSIVEKTATEVVEYAGGTYNYFKGYIPSILMSPVTFTEQMVSPVFAKAQGMAHYVLVSVDGKVDYGLSKTNEYYKVGAEKTSDVVGKPASDQFKEAKTKYMGIVTESCKFVRREGFFGSVSGLYKRRAEVVETLKGAAVAITSTAVKSAFGAADFVSKQSVVKNTVAKAKPYTSWVQAQYMALHAFIMSLPIYAALYNVLVSTYSAVTETTYFKSVNDWFFAIIHPHVSFATDPIVETSTPYISALSKHLEPKTAAQEKADEVMNDTSTQAKKTAKGAKKEVKGAANEVEKKME